MHLIEPFRALRPAPGRAGEIIAPPYDVMSTAEARVMVRAKPHSFLHVSRPEIDLPEGCDPSAPATYAKACDNFRTLQEQDLLLRDPRPYLYVYRLTQGKHSQTGLAAVASVAAYRDGRIKKHELTRPAKEDDRVRHIESLNAQTGPVFLIHRDSGAIGQTLSRHCAATPDIAAHADDGVLHEIWALKDRTSIETLRASYDALDALYIADGHHRAAAAARVAEERSTTADAQGFLAVIFPADQTRILAYNRVIRDLHGLTTETFLKRVAENFDLNAQPTPVPPEAPGIFSLYLERAWYRLEPKAPLRARIADRDPAARLDTSLLQDFLIQPILGIDNPRTDERIDFVGGSRGIAGLTDPVDQGQMRLALALHPTSATDLMAVADANALMPPKSTWFEPKLADGLLCHLLC